MEGMQHEPGSRLGTKCSTQAASSVMSFGLLISLDLPKLPFRLSLILFILLSAGFLFFLTLYYYYLFNIYIGCNQMQTLNIVQTPNYDLFWCRGAEVDVKRLPKRPAPPAFGRKLTDSQKALFLS